MTQLVREIVGPDGLRLYFPKSVRWGEMIGDPVHEEIANEIADCLGKGREVAFACAGDIALYSPFSYLCPHLKRRGVEWVIYPSVSFLNALSAVLGQQLVTEADNLLVAKLNDVSELDGMLSVASNIVLYDFKNHQLPALLEFARQEGLEYVGFGRIERDLAASVQRDLLRGEVPLGTGLVLIKKSLEG